ncbi:hypothetical protein [uncultured Winogradskyella sp.]|uniref:hypothetical protein n=1 Tax=uncultured Winogradskyella sp. TaxID=395353 RepID=UPI00261A904B|nr:hypothetical protein [uncultured Winogradskyella sp.]
MTLKEFVKYKSKQFHSIADSDYLSFRFLEFLEMQYKMICDFAGAQSLEKYIKCALLLSNQKTHKEGHNLTKLLSKLKAVDRVNRFFDTLDPFCLDVLERLCKDLNRSADTRYLASNYNPSDIGIVDKMDTAVLQVLRPLNQILYQEIYAEKLHGIVDDAQHIDFKKFYPNLFQSLNFNNKILHPPEFKKYMKFHTNRISVGTFQLPLIIIITDENIDKKNKIEEFLGLKLSSSEYEKTYLLDQREIIDSESLKEKGVEFETILKARRNKRITTMKKEH